MTPEFIAKSDRKGNLYLEQVTQITPKGADTQRVVVPNVVSYQTVGPNGAFLLHDGTEIFIAYVDPSANDAELSLTVTGRVFTVSLATGPTGTITTTGDDIKALLQADSTFAYLMTVADKAGNDGSGAVTAMSPTALTAGTLETALTGNNNDLTYTMKTTFAGPWGAVQAVGGNAVITFTTTADSGAVTVSSQTITNGVLYHIPMSSITRVSGTTIAFYA